MSLARHIEAGLRPATPPRGAGPPRRPTAAWTIRPGTGQGGNDLVQREPLSEILAPHGGESLPPRLEGVDNAARCPPHGFPLFCDGQRGLQRGRRWRERGSEQASLAQAAKVQLVGLPALDHAVGRSVATQARERPLEARRSRVHGPRLPTPHPVAAFASRGRYRGFPTRRGFA